MLDLRTSVERNNDTIISPWLQAWHFPLQQLLLALPGTLKSRCRKFPARQTIVQLLAVFNTIRAWPAESLLLIGTRQLPKRRHIWPTKGITYAYVPVTGCAAYVIPCVISLIPSRPPWLICNHLTLWMVLVLLLLWIQIQTALVSLLSKCKEIDLKSSHLCITADYIEIDGATTQCNNAPNAPTTSRICGLVFGAHDETMAMFGASTVCGKDT